ncbi:unnamed protein product [Acanthoscelides obtectus]|uniref:Uncharacterized protein n=1 Tax=Acanthoscelides obtectus TaxID=200917 RepID=A0A9P0KUN3_ACAOB|nr:unnamed protein product [Acanthoscelides obtectus]CAK1672115.1 hypothetical protein AOBTE_LOCUS28653 [Acanthoscelides obtectus]
MRKIQEQTAHSLAILGSQLNSLLSNNPNGSKELAASLADAAQLTCNIHHAISTHRKYNILPSARKLAETSKTDEFLFGKNFVVDLKSLDAAKKASFELKANRARLFQKAPLISTNKQQPIAYNRQNYPDFQTKNLNWKRQPQKSRKKDPRSGIFKSHIFL